MKIKQIYLVLLFALATWAQNAAASVRVYGEASSTGPSISVRIYADITDPPIVSHSFKLYYNSSQLRVVAASRNEEVWFFHDGTRVIPQPAPVTTPAGEVLFVSGYMDARQPRTGVTGNRVLLGTVLFARGTENTPNFDLTVGRAGNFANFVGLDGTVLEGKGGQVSMQSVAADGSDQDLDGLRDKWEDKFFRDTRGVYYSDDPDGDGVSNLDEAMMGSDPTDAQSNLHLTVTERRGRVLLEWTSAEDRIYTIEGGKFLGKFETVQGNIKATPPKNSVQLDRSELPETMFFRLQVEAAPGP